MPVRLVFLMLMLVLMLAMEEVCLWLFGKVTTG